MLRLIAQFLLFCVLMGSLACSPPADQTPPPSSATPNSNVNILPTAEAPLPFVNIDGSDGLLPAEFEKRWTGDFDAMVARRTIRALVVYSRTSYFLDGLTARGMAYEALKEFEAEVNRQLKKQTVQVHVIFIPVASEQLIPALLAGVGDVAVANFTVTEARRQVIDFSDPVAENVKEIIVSGPQAPTISKLEDLAGKEIHVRESSSYYESLLLINRQFSAEGKQPISLVKANKYLEDEDLLEMVNAGLIPMTVVDNHIAEVWQRALDNITLHEDIAVRSGGSIAWAFRKHSPRLATVVNEFLRTHRKGTLFGNVLFQRYLQNASYVKNPLTVNDMPRLLETLELFKKYGDMYNFDWSMLAAQAYQESGIDQSKRSPAGAVGVMQVLPSTAADKNVAINDIDKIENNIHAGVKYLRFIADRYFKDENMDEFNKAMFAFAAYNAGPAKVTRLRTQAKEDGLDPDVWFNNVEIIAAKQIGRETVQYISNILKYWLTFKLLRKDQLAATI
ncbi:MAG: transglycosylase SLT domain-containing protein [Pseudomonadales bacterium]